MPTKKQLSRNRESEFEYFKTKNHTVMENNKEAIPKTATDIFRERFKSDLIRSYEGAIVAAMEEYADYWKQLAEAAAEVIKVMDIPKNIPRLDDVSQFQLFRERNHIYQQLKNQKPKTLIDMVRLEYFNGKEWIDAGEPAWPNENIAWISLGGDDFNYRTVDENGKVLTDKSFGNNIHKYNEYKLKSQKPN